MGYGVLTSLNSADYKGRGKFNTEDLIAWVNDVSRLSAGVWMLFFWARTRATTSLAVGRAVGSVPQQSSIRFHITSSSPRSRCMSADGRVGLFPCITCKVTVISFEIVWKGTFPENTFRRELSAENQGMIVKGGVLRSWHIRMRIYHWLAYCGTALRHPLVRGQEAQVPSTLRFH